MLEAAPKRIFGMTMVVGAAVLAVLGPTIHEPDSYQLFAHEGAAVFTGLIGIWIAASPLTLREQMKRFLEAVYADDSLPRKLMEARDPRAGDGGRGD